MLLSLLFPFLNYGQIYEVIDSNAGSPTYGQRSRYEVRGNSQLDYFDYSNNFGEYDHNVTLKTASKLLIYSICAI